MNNGPVARKDAADEALERLGVKKREPVEHPDPVKDMEDFINSIEDIDKREAMSAKLREIKANAELRAREAEARLRQGGKAVTETNTGGKRWTVVDGKPIEDPEGEYESFAQAYKVAALEAAKATDPTSFFKFLKSEGLIGEKTTGSDFTQDLAKRYLDNIDALLKGPGKGSSEEVRGEITTLRDEVRRMSDPVEIIAKAKALTDGLRSAGLIPEPSTGGGGSLEELKETHRHEEKLEELRTEKAYKEKVSSTLSELPERIGHGFAEQLMGAEEEASSSSAIKYYTCTEEGCGFKIPITPETGDQVVCGKCGTVYNRKKAVETEEK